MAHGVVLSKIFVDVSVTNISSFAQGTGFRLVAFKFMKLCATLASSTLLYLQRIVAHIGSTSEE